MDCEDFEIGDAPASTGFKLRGRQQEWCGTVESDERAGFSRLLFLGPGGIGKGSILGYLAKKKWEQQGIRTLVTENREHLVGQMAERIRDEIGLECDVEMAGQSASPSAPCVVASVQTLGRINRLISFSDDHFGFVVPDECFPSWVKVDGRPISEIKIGHFVSSYNHVKNIIESRRVVAASNALAKSLVELNCGGKKIICTRGHPFYTKRGYVQCSDLRRGDELAIDRVQMLGLSMRRDEVFDVRTEDCCTVRAMQRGVSCKKEEEGNRPLQAVLGDGDVRRNQAVVQESRRSHMQASLLQYGMSGFVDTGNKQEINSPEAHGPQQGIRFRKDEKEQPNEGSGNEGEGGCCESRENVHWSRWERADNEMAKGVVGCHWICPDGMADKNRIRRKPVSISAAVLQGGHSHSGAQISDRSGWEHAQIEEVEISGYKEDRSIEFIRLDSVEILESGGGFRFSEVCPDSRVYNLEVEGNNNYFADGFLVHNCHLSLAPQPSRILSYFHWGAESLEENWQRPKDGQYKPKSTICGFTATPNIGGGRHLSELYHRVSVNYSYLSAIEEGWLVGIEERNIPVTIDTRKFRTKRTSEGAAFNSTDQSAAIIPVIAELAKQIVREAFDRKTICFLPSVECARLMTEALKGMGMRAIFVSGECLDKSDKIDEYNAAPMGTVLCNCALVVYGIDFIDTNCIAPFSAVISKANYGQKIYRGTRVLRGVLKDGMTARERRSAIAASAKPKLLVLSPFFISDRIDICEIFDLFTDVPREKGKKPKTGGDFTTPEKMRDWLAAIEKAADPHRNKQARTIDPVLYSLSIGQQRIDAMPADDNTPANREELDALLAFGIDTTKLMTSATAQRLIGTLRERDRLGLASAKAVTQLKLRLGWPEELASKMKGRQAGVLIARGVRYSAPKASQTMPEDDPALAYGEG